MLFTKVVGICVIGRPLASGVFGEIETTGIESITIEEGICGRLVANGLVASMRG